MMFCNTASAHPREDHGRPKYIEEKDHGMADPFESNDEKEEEIMDPQNPGIKRLCVTAAQSGFIMSLLVQLATVGIDFLLCVLVSREVIQQKRLDMIILPAVSCALNVILAVCNLSILHNLATHEYYNASPRRSTTTKEDMRTDKVLQEIFYDVDISYILGAVTGISLLWTSMDFLMGLQRQLVFPATVLVLALLCLTMSQGYHAVRKSRKFVDGEESAYYALPDSSLERNDSSFHMAVV